LQIIYHELKGMELERGFAGLQIIYHELKGMELERGLSQTILFARSSRSLFAEGGCHLCVLGGLRGTQQQFLAVPAQAKS